MSDWERGRRWAALLLGLLACVVWLWPSAEAARFEPLGAGHEVKDHRTGLVWRRCAEGQHWSGGQCLGSALTMPHLEALALAESQSGWRLPSVTELYSLVEPDRRLPALDAAVFPNTPNAWFWTSTLSNSRISHAWLVHLGEGQANFALRLNHVHVRLVR